MDPRATFLGNLARGSVASAWIGVAPRPQRRAAKAFSKSNLVHDWHQAVTCVCKTRKRHAIHLKVSGPVISFKAPKRTAAAI